VLVRSMNTSDKYGESVYSVSALRRRNIQMSSAVCVCVCVCVCLCLCLVCVWCVLVAPLCWSIEGRRKRGAVS